MKEIFIYSLPRGGTNLVCALMHNNEHIFSLTQRGTKAYLNSILDGLNTGEMLTNEFMREHQIYSSGGIFKNYNNIECCLFDKVHWDKKRGSDYLDLTDNLVKGGESKAIVLLRHPLSVLNSMHGFHVKYGRPGWAITAENVALFLENYYLPLLARIKNNDFIIINLESFFSNVADEYQRLCENINVDFHVNDTDFKKSFKHHGAWLGSDFSIKDSDKRAGGFYQGKTSNVEEKVFYCNKSQQATIGYGEFNPYKSIDVNRLLGFKFITENKILKQGVEKVFLKSFSKEDVEYFFNSEILDLKYLKKIGYRSVSSYRKRVSIIPKINRKLQKTCDGFFK